MMDINNPFAKALITEGQRRGYSPMAIAASLGNANQENGLRTDGRPGDNGTAFGGFQWRNERKTALDRAAAQMGTTWNDPSAQANHWWTEQDGSESRWGLKNAKTLEEANRSVISSLRPAGWTAQNPEAGHAYGNRLRGAMEAQQLLQGGRVPTMDQGAPTGSQGDPRADMPSEDGQQVSFQPPGGEEPKEGLDAFMSGGPGALIGMPQDGWSLGGALRGASAAMMALDNPAAAAVVADNKGNAEKYTTHYDKERGTMIKMDRKGNITTEQVAQPKTTRSIERFDPVTGKAIMNNGDGTFGTQDMLPPQEKPTPIGVVKKIEENDKEASDSYNILQANSQFLKQLKEGSLDMTAVARLGDSWQSAMGSSDEKTRNAALFRAHLEDLRNARLRLNKGVQTEGDAQRELDALIPGLGKYDNKTVASQLQRIDKGFESSMVRSQSNNEPLLRQYKSYDPDGIRMGDYKKRAETYRSSREGLDKEIATWQSQAAPAPTGTPTTGANPVRTPQTRGSFKDFSLGRGRPQAPQQPLPLEFEGQ